MFMVVLISYFKIVTPNFLISAVHSKYAWDKAVCKKIFSKYSFYGKKNHYYYYKSDHMTL